RSGAVSLRIRLTEVGERCLSVSAVDDDGAPVLLIDEVRTHPLDASGLVSPQSQPDAMFRVEWTQLPTAAQTPQGLRLAELGQGAVIEESGGLTIERYADLEALSEALAAGAPAPEHVVVTVES